MSTATTTPLIRPHRTQTKPASFQVSPQPVPIDAYATRCSLSRPANLSGATGNSTAAPGRGQAAPMNRTRGGSGSGPTTLVEAPLPVPQDASEMDTIANNSPAHFGLEMGMDPGSFQEEDGVCAEDPADMPAPQPSDTPTGVHVYPFCVVELCMHMRSYVDNTHGREDLGLSMLRCGGWSGIRHSRCHAVLLRYGASVLHGGSSKRLALPRNTKDRKHLQSTQSAQPTHLTDQAPSTTERTARETHNTN